MSAKEKVLFNVFFILFVIVLLNNNPRGGGAKSHSELSTKNITFLFGFPYNLLQNLKQRQVAPPEASMGLGQTPTKITPL